jgi:hypothetical protein
MLAFRDKLLIEQRDGPNGPEIARLEEEETVARRLVAHYGRPPDGVADGHPVTKTPTGGTQVLTVE